MLVHKHNTLATIRSRRRFIDSFAQLVASEDNAKWFKYAAYAMTAFSVIFLLVLIGASHPSGLDGLLVALTLVMHCVCVYVCALSAAIRKSIINAVRIIDKVPYKSTRTCAHQRTDHSTLTRAEPHPHRHRRLSFTTLG